MNFEFIPSSKKAIRFIAIEDGSIRTSNRPIVRASSDLLILSPLGSGERIKADGFLGGDFHSDQILGD